MTELLAILAGAAAIWALAVRLNRRRVRACDGHGDPRHGIVVFTEPIRWLFIIWGFSPACRGLRRAGFRGRIHLVRWGTVAGALLVIPDLVRRRRLLRHAQRLARLVDELAREHPGSPIHLIGYSTGCYVTLEACRRIRARESVGRVVLMAGAISPRYDWDGLEHRVRVVHSFFSPLDWISGLGPLLFGSNDRRWGRACGAVGFEEPPSFVVQRCWRPADLRVGYFGGHFTVASPLFVAEQIAPLLRRRPEDDRDPRSHEQVHDDRVYSGWERRAAAGEGGAGRLARSDRR